MDLVARFRGELRDLGARPGSRLGLAVSGGADSTALMVLAAEAAGELRLELRLIHVDHALRDSSAVDAVRATAAADALRMPWTIIRTPVPRQAGLSLEAAARDARYDSLRRAAVEFGLDMVATAHTLDDQAETVLLRVLRGAGTTSLQAVRKRTDRIIRPLLWARRSDLRSWLRSRAIEWVEDPSNDDTRLERNWLRHEVVPLLQARRPGVMRAVARLADHAAGDAEIVEDAVDEVLRACPRAGDTRRLPVGLAATLRPGLWRRVLHRAIREAGGRADEETVRRAGDLLTARTGAQIRAGHAVVSRSADALVVCPSSPPPLPVRLPPDGFVTAPQWSIAVRIGEARREPWWWRCTLDAADAADLSIRGRRPGDRIRTTAGTRKVQDVLVDAKVPAVLRDRVPVLDAGGRAVAVVGLAVPPVADGRQVAVDVRPEETLEWMPTPRPRS